MEAEVYPYGADAVLKLFPGTASLADQITLKHFYDSLDRSQVPFALPRILTITPEESVVVTTEQRLPGTRLSALLPGLSVGALEAWMQRSLTAALALNRFQSPANLDRYKLFDPAGLSRRTDGDWHQFLARLLTHKLQQVAPFLERDVPHFGRKLDQLRAILAQPYAGDYHLIHGDYFPGNLLVNAVHQINAVLDFGLLTMWGDPLFDTATGWVFFDMYDELQANARERYLAIILERLGESVRGRLYRYVLLYSILGANTYSPTCADGHHLWCVANLNRDHYWAGVE